MRRGITALLVLVLGYGTVSGAENPVRNVIQSSKGAVYEIANGKGSVRLMLNETTGSEKVALSVLTLRPGAEVPAHIHEDSDEILYIQSGSAQVVINGRPYTVNRGDAIHIPAGVKHSARVLGKRRRLTAIQVYAEPGPEQRFTKGRRIR